MVEYSNSNDKNRIETIYNVISRSYYHGGGGGGLTIYLYTPQFGVHSSSLVQQERALP
jgi:hypothetical protein